jgi:hypothetical protein
LHNPQHIKSIGTGIRKSIQSKKDLYLEISGDIKPITTGFGVLSFGHTYYRSRRKNGYAYLLDCLKGIERFCKTTCSDSGDK